MPLSVRLWVNQHVYGDSGITEPGTRSFAGTPEDITQNSLNGVVRYQVVRAPAGNEAISPAVSSSTCPSSISILAAPSKTKNVSLPGRVHCTGPVTSVKRDKPD